jgi:hypothetical protein
MERRHYLAIMRPDQRFRVVRRGIWRVSFELHPDRVFKHKTDRAHASSTAVTATHDVVAAYARARFNNPAYKPREHELSHAETLISDFGQDAVLRVLPRVVEQVKQQSKGDVYFGFAVPYFRKELSATMADRRLREKIAATSGMAHVDQIRLADEGRQRQQQRAALLAMWRNAAEGERAAYRAQALQNATSETARRRILNCDLDEPVREILHELDLVARRGVNVG